MVRGAPTILKYNECFFVVNCDGCSANKKGDLLAANSHFPGDQITPSFRKLEDKVVVGVWNSINQDGDNGGVFGSLFEVIGDENDELTRIGSEFPVNTFTLGDQTRPDVSGMITKGSKYYFLVVWENEWNINENGSWCCSIRGQVFRTFNDQSPTPMGEETILVSNHSKKPSVVALHDSDLVFLTYIRFDYGYEIMGSVFNISGTKGNFNPVQVSDRIRINSYTQSHQNRPKVFLMLDQMFGIVWESYGQDEYENGIYLQMYKWTGHGIIINVKVGSERKVNSVSKGDQSHAMAINIDRHQDTHYANRSYTGIVWQSTGGDDGPIGVFLRWGVYDYLEEKFTWISGDMKMNKDDQGDHRNPNIGYFVDEEEEKWFLTVAWQGQDLITYDDSYNTTVMETHVRSIYYDITDPTEIPKKMGNESSVTNSPSFGETPSQIVGITSDRYIVAWQEIGLDYRGYGIAVQLLSGNTLPFLVKSLEHQSVLINSTFNFTIPLGNFRHEVESLNDSLSYTANIANTTYWPDWMHFNETNGNFTGDAPIGCTTVLVIQINATDQCGGSVTGEFNLTLINSAPTLENKISNLELKVGEDFEFIFDEDSFADSEGEDLTYKIASGNETQDLPDWLYFTSSKRKFYGHVPLQCSKTYLIILNASDPCNQNATDNFTMSLVRYPPYVNEAIEDQTVYGEEDFYLQFDIDTFIDPHDDELEYKATLDNDKDLPDWLLFDPGKRTFTGTAPNDNENLLIKLTAINTCEEETSDYFYIKIRYSEEAERNDAKKLSLNLVLFFSFILYYWVFLF
ncbi:dystroglycan-related [Anaeramoeba flamelloides]|uniref:Dystroglycan-related n=1 Tax=Anaeramoeba flamelloides TaxID=1746091 RepID=A0ABQ8XN24_9EUKA|nr:dystroglycan-related [Anaeramoeba flamelloides]